MSNLQPQEEGYVEEEDEVEAEEDDDDAIFNNAYEDWGEYESGGDDEEEDYYVGDTGYYIEEEPSETPSYDDFAIYIETPEMEEDLSSFSDSGESYFSIGEEKEEEEIPRDDTQKSMDWDLSQDDINEQEVKVVADYKLHQSADWDGVDFAFQESYKFDNVALSYEEESDVEEGASKDIAKEKKPQQVADLPTKVDSGKQEFSVPFCGRKTELESMRDALAKAEAATTTTADSGKQRQRRIVWVSGNTGVGKSTLVDVFCQKYLKPVTDFYVCQGCFDENTSTRRPFAAISDCFVQIVDCIIRDPEVDGWRETIREGLGREIKLFTAFVPNTAILLDLENTYKPSAVFDTSNKRLFGRLRFTLRKFIRLVCKQKNLVMRLDDLHSAEDESLKLLETFLPIKAPKMFFFIGCHRGAKSTRSLSKVKTKFENLIATEIMLENLDKQVTQDLLATHLGRLVKSESDPNAADEAMAQFVNFLFQKTGGNPLFLVHLINLLFESDMIHHDDTGWNFDKALGSNDDTIPSNSLDVITRRIEALPTRVKLVYQSVGLLGLMRFRADILYNAVIACHLAQVGEDDTQPFQDFDSFEKALELLTGDLLLEKAGSSGYYIVAHANVRRAAALQLSTKKKIRKMQHFRFASQLIQTKVEESHNQAIAKEERKLLVVEHCGASSDNLQSEKMRSMLAKLNLDLAELAMAKAAFKTAIQRLESGISYLDHQRRWTDFYDITHKLYLALARSKFCVGSIDEAIVFADAVLANSRTPRDKIGAYQLLIWTSLSRNNTDAAFKFTIKGLEDIWKEAPQQKNVDEELRRIRLLFNNKADAEFLMLPKMDHRKAESKMTFLALLAEVSVLKRDHLHQDLAVLRMAEITMQYGTSDLTGLVFALYGILLTRRGLQSEAYRFGHLAKMLCQAGTAHGSRAIAYYHWAIHFWRRPVKTSLQPLLNISNGTMDSIDMENVSFALGAFLSNVFICGSPLKSCDALYRKFHECHTLFKARDPWMVTIPFQAMKKLRGISSESQELKASEREPRAVQYDLFFQMVVAVFLQDLSGAERLCDKIFLKPEGVWVPYRAFIEGLIATHFARIGSGKIRIKHQRKASLMLDMLGTWARKGMKHGFHMANMLDAELRIAVKKETSPKEASSLFDVAIDAAARDRFIHHEALANERAGLYFLSIEEKDIASTYLSQAYRLYEKWGAQAKLHLLKAEYPDYLNADPPPPRKVSIQQLIEHDRKPMSFRGRVPQGRGRGRGRGPMYGRGMGQPGRRGRGPMPRPGSGIRSPGRGAARGRMRGGRVNSGPGRGQRARGIDPRRLAPGRGRGRFEVDGTEAKREGSPVTSEEERKKPLSLRRLLGGKSKKKLTAPKKKKKKSKPVAEGAIGGEPIGQSFSWLRKGVKQKPASQKKRITGQPTDDGPDKRPSKKGSVKKKKPKTQYTEDDLNKSGKGEEPTFSWLRTGVKQNQPPQQKRMTDQPLGDDPEKKPPKKGSLKKKKSKTQLEEVSPHIAGKDVKQIVEQKASLKKKKIKSQPIADDPDKTIKKKGPKKKKKPKSQLIEDSPPSTGKGEEQSFSWQRKEVKQESSSEKNTFKDNSVDGSPYEADQGEAKASRRKVTAGTSKRKSKGKASS